MRRHVEEELKHRKRVWPSGDAQMFAMSTFRDKGLFSLQARLRPVIIVGEVRACLRELLPNHHFGIAIVPRSSGSFDRVYLDSDIAILFGPEGQRNQLSPSHISEDANGSVRT